MIVYFVILGGLWWSWSRQRIDRHCQWSSKITTKRIYLRKN